MSDRTKVDLLRIGREALLDRLLKGVAIADARRPGQHTILVGPPGSGRSALLDAVRREIEGWDPPCVFVRLPEHGPGLGSPTAFARAIRLALEAGRDGGARAAVGDDPDGAGGIGDSTAARWTEDEDWDREMARWREAWGRLAEERSRELAPDGPTARPEVELPTLVLAIEGLEQRLRDTFPDDAARSRLRRLLSETSGLVVLATTDDPELDRHYDDRLFHGLAHEQLAPWSLEQCREASRRHDRPTLDRGDPDAWRREAALQVLRPYIGGLPRRVLQALELWQPSLAAGDLYDRLEQLHRAEILTVVQGLSPRAELLLDTLVACGEPTSQSELADRLHTTQNRIAQSFAQLRERRLLQERRVPGSSRRRHELHDRLLAHSLRRRSSVQAWLGRTELASAPSLRPVLNGLQSAALAARGHAERRRGLRARTLLLEAFASPLDAADAGLELARQEDAEGRATAFREGARQLDSMAPEHHLVLLASLLAHEASAELVQDLAGVCSPEIALVVTALVDASDEGSGSRQPTKGSRRTTVPSLAEELSTDLRLAADQLAEIAGIRRPEVDGSSRALRSHPV